MKSLATEIETSDSNSATLISLIAEFKFFLADNSSTFGVYQKLCYFLLSFRTYNQFLITNKKFSARNSWTDLNISVFITKDLILKYFKIKFMKKNMVLKKMHGLRVTIF